MPKFPYSTIHQDVYTPPSTLLSPVSFAVFFLGSLPAQREREKVVFYVSSQDNWKRAADSVGYRRRNHSLWGPPPASGSRWGHICARGASAGLNMCTLLSFRRNNTHYLARDKCLNRRIIGCWDWGGRETPYIFRRPVFRLIKARPAVLPFFLPACLLPCLL